MLIMRIEIKYNSVKTIPASMLIDLYKNAGWWEERTEDHLTEMLKTTTAVGAWLDERLVGFARAVTDGRFRAYIEDVVVHSDFRRYGIGEQLITKLLEEIQHIDIVSLFCEDSYINFYARSGFIKSKSQFVMHRKQTK